MRVDPLGREKRRRGVIRGPTDTGQGSFRGGERVESKDTTISAVMPRSLRAWAFPLPVGSQTFSKARSRARGAPEGARRRTVRRHSAAEVESARKKAGVREPGRRVLGAGVPRDEVSSNAQPGGGELPGPEEPPQPWARASSFKALDTRSWRRQSIL